MGENIFQITIKFTEWLQNIPNGRTIDQTAIKYTYQHLQSLPKLGFLV
jgi:hypothetical protein